MQTRTTRQEIRHLLHDIGFVATKILVDAIKHDVNASGESFRDWEKRDFQFALRQHEHLLIDCK